MSAWRIGTDSTVAAGGNGPGGKFAAIADKLVKWIPGDTLALYVPGVALIATKPNTALSWWFLIVMLVVNPIIIILGAFASGEKFGKRLTAKLGLGTLAFAIWTLTVPSSGWQAWKLVADNPTAVTIIAAVVGLLFGYVADGIMRRL